MSKCKLMATSQPEDWIEAFQRQASLEGLTISEWVGLACLKSLPFSDEAHWSPQEALEAYNLSQRPQKGKYERKSK